MNDKQAVRAQMKRLRRELNPAYKKALDQAVLENLLSLPEFEAGKCLFVYCYVSMDGEVDTFGLMEKLWLQKIPVAVPRVEDGVIRFYRIHGLEDLEPGCMGILEPSAKCPPADCPSSVVLTPGLAFTPEGERIGYGGGYYDRFFAKEPEHTRIAAAYPFQILPTLPTEGFDRRMQMIVTSEQIYHCGK